MTTVTLPANPLLSFADLQHNPLPDFAAVHPDHIDPAIAALIARAQVAVDEVIAIQEPSWESVVIPLETATEALSRAWGMVGHLNSVMDSEALRAAYNQQLPVVTAFWTALGQNLHLYEQYKKIAAREDFKALSLARQKVIQNALRNFRLSGAELDDDAKLRFAEIQTQQAALAQKFSENILDATNDYAWYITDQEQLKGIPADELAAMAEAATQDIAAGRCPAEVGTGCWKLSLHLPSYLPVMQYAENRALRASLYQAYVTRAAEFPNSNGKVWDNSQIMVDLLTLRAEEASLLGYQNYAETSLASKMADSPAQVIDFLLDLAKRARPYAEQDIAELRQFAASRFGLETLEAWDIPYVAEKLREERYDFSENEVKQYFPENQVLEGLFRLIQTLFNVVIKPDNLPVWHPSVRSYRIEQSTGTLVGQFYLDPYARAGKRGGAWMDDVRGRKRLDDQVQTPIAHLVCNFPTPVGNKPALLTHDDVITLFHEFGHGLHHLLTQVDELGVSGISGVEWDAVELPSQFMENFCWEWEVLKNMTAHVDTGAPLPKGLYEKMLAAKNFQSGMQTLRQVEFALFDMRLHSQPAGAVIDVQQILNDVRASVAVIAPPAFNRFQHSFSHIFAGGYAAGYYSYKWAEVLSADAYAQFEEDRELTNPAQSIVNTNTGQRYWREILAVGGSRPALESFMAFRGRRPNIDALLRHNGMQQPQTMTRPNNL
ncbi:M3 family metallopeptidase [Parvibium lacunae]|uniref:oligopeptidase A n=1 Tax=Parvibium lacunae TaxID=1888893 RepID=A0A368L702_9BURK|nr:M3 family metallopeptidase [Parvibium lacunae]RCS59468.1 M3 family peptidase [Parvibium lacunae]